MIKEDIKDNLKELIKPIILLIGVTAMVIFLISMQSSLNRKKYNNNDFVYVSKVILPNVHPVVKIEDETIGLPYNSNDVEEVRGYYDYNASEDVQEKALIFYDNTYIQNSGIDYSSKEPFDVVSILDGTITTVKEDNLLGKIIEIKHSNELISEYQSLGEISVKEGDQVTKGQVIAKTGTNNISSSLDNHLHFELYYKGQVVNPANYYNKTLKEL